MLIKEYDIYTLKLDNSFVDINSIITSMDTIYYIRMFLIYSFASINRGKVLNSIQELESFFEDGISFEMVDISIDRKNNLVYLSEGYYEYRYKPTTQRIEELFEKGNFIELCKMGFLEYAVMTKENFIYILLAWNKILDDLPPFVLLYKDDKDWYDILPFDSQDAMEKFVADHRKSV